MNFDIQIARSISLAEDTVKQVNDLKQQYESCKEFTEKFLACCGKYKIDIVSIGTKTNQVKSCKGWPFGYSGSVFADGKTKDDWPAIWAVVDEMGISGGCGNSGQHSADTSRLVDGVYKLQDGKWMKIENEEGK